jgi:hypothetical protein
MLPTGPWILLAASANTIITTIHHLHGARIYSTPERYTSVWIASAALLLAGAFAVLGAGTSRAAHFCRRAFVVTVVLFFVLVFGVAEGLSTHVVYPALQGGYGAEEPFDALFQVTGVLQVIPAVVVTALLLSDMRSLGRTASDEQTVDAA